MASVTVNWETFKAEVANRKVPMQAMETEDVHLLCIFDGNLEMNCVLRKNDEAFEASIAEFQNVYKASCNKTPTVQKPFADPLGFRLRLKGIKQEVTAGQVTHVDYKMVEERWINGAQLIVKNAGPDDTVNFSIVDVDNILGHGAHTVLDEFTSDWNISSDRENQGEHIIPYPARIPANLYLRFSYNSTGEDNPTLKVNLFLHKKT